VQKHTTDCLWCQYYRPVLRRQFVAHLLQVTGIAVSDRHPYMFSGSLDKEVKCWDLEYNKARFITQLTVIHS
jgi:WD40 repeat protein